MIQPITPEELENINQYRRSSASAFLTIMFTSIKDFNQTRKLQGLEYIKTILALHDAVLEETIEKDRAGMLVKRIDDSYVGVFASPAMAIDRTIQIQSNLKKINDAHPELENIEVMIGLETGQVTVGEEIQVELFNHHLKRAYELQNMADGGQILLGFSPDDWFLAQDPARFAWKKHGLYDTPDRAMSLDIYEVIEKELGKPKPPIRGRRHKTFPWLKAAAVLLVLAGLAGGAWLFSNRTSVWFVHMPPDARVKLDTTTLVVLDGTAQNEARKCLIPISAGRHILHFNINAQVKYFSEINVAKGKNYIEPRFTEVRLPSLGKRLDINSDNNYSDEVSATERFEYNTYTADNVVKPHTATLTVTMKGRKAGEKPDPLVFDLTSSIVLDGKTVHEETRSIPSSEAEAEHMDVEVPVYQDNEHYYYLRYGIYHPSAQLEIGANYIEYLKPEK